MEIKKGGKKEKSEKFASTHTRIHGRERARARKRRTDPYIEKWKERERNSALQWLSQEGIISYENPFLSLFLSHFLSLPLSFSQPRAHRRSNSSRARMWNKAHQGFSPQSAFDELKMSPRSNKNGSSDLSLSLSLSLSFSLSLSLASLPLSPIPSLSHYLFSLRRQYGIFPFIGAIATRRLFSSLRIGLTSLPPSSSCDIAFPLSLSLSLSLSLFGFPMPLRACARGKKSERLNA